MELGLVFRQKVRDRGYERPRDDRLHLTFQAFWCWRRRSARTSASLDIKIEFSIIQLKRRIFGGLPETALDGRRGCRQIPRKTAFDEFSDGAHLRGPVQPDHARIQ